MVKTKALLLYAISSLYLLTTPVLSWAAENGTGVYLLGSKDKKMGVFPSKGLFLRNDFSFQSGEFYGLYLHGKEFNSIKNWVAVNNTSLNYYFGKQVFGGTYMAGMELRIVSNEITVDPAVINGITKSNHSAFGLGNLKIIPIAIGWKNRRFFHYSLSIAFYLPVGNYDPESFANTSKNYFSVDPEFSATWFNEYTNTDISGNIGLTYNFSNPSTNYRSGSELHAEYSVVQGIERQWGIGAVGYFYYQLTPDTGEGLVNDNISRCNGFGPIFTYNLRRGRTAIGLIAKMFLTFGNQNTLYSNSYWLGVSFKIW